MSATSSGGGTEGGGSAIAVATTATAAIPAAATAARYQPTVRRLVRGEHSELADQVPVAQLQRLRAVLSSLSTAALSWGKEGRSWSRPTVLHMYSGARV